MGLAQPKTSKGTETPPARVVCVLFRYEGGRGSEQELGGLLSDFARQVCDEESGCLSYVVTQAMGSATHFVVHAQFVDWDAFEAHAATPHGTRLLPRLTRLLDAPISMEIFLGL